MSISMSIYIYLSIYLSFSLSLYSIPIRYLSISILSISSSVSISISISMSISISKCISIVFSNRIENVKHSQATATAWFRFCYAVGLCGWVSVRCQSHQSYTRCSVRKPKSQWWCHTSYPPNPSELSARAQKEFKIGFRCEKHHW